MAMVEKKGDDDIKEICTTTPEKNLKSSVLITNNKSSTMEKDLSSSSICNIDQEELLKSTKAKMGEVREENERLKKLLAQIVMNYKSLEKQISLMDKANLEKETRNNYEDDDGQDPELVSLTLGSWTSSKKDNDDDTDIKKYLSDDWNKRRKIDAGLKLGLDCKFEHNLTVKSENISMNDSKLDCKETKEENTERWSSNEGLKSKENTNSKEGDEENLHPLPVKKTRVCIRSRCDTPTMNDGCQWRKYGQKIAKGNPCPRAYYRCTVSPTCPVRKQVQRCADDMSILITTYEGTHNHPLPLSATAMASATTAAAAMLKTGPLTSQPSLVGPTTTPTSTSLGLHSSSSTPLINNPFNTNPRLSIPLNPSMISASSHSHPTITLDLTTPNTTNISPFHNLLSSSSSRNNNNNINNNPNSSSFLNFSSTSNSLDFNSRATPLQTSTSWTTNYFNYGTLFPNNTIMNNRNPIYQNPTTTTTNNNNSQQSLNETIAAVATKAIASNPNFQSVLAAAISSYVGTNNNINNNNNDNNNKVSNKPKKSSSPPRNNNAQLMLFPTSLPLPLSPKNSASTPTDSRDHIS